MSRNDPRPNSHWQTPALQRSLALCLLIALLAGLCSSHLAGENTTPPTSESSKVASENSIPSRMFQSPRKLTFSATDRSRMAPRPSAAPAPAVSSSRSQDLASTAKKSVKRDSAVQPASHEELSGTPPGSFGLSPDAPSSNLVPSPLSPVIPHARPAAPGPSFLFPSERAVPPQITGSHLGLQPGETATERSLRLMTVIADLEEQNAQLAEQNAKLSAELKAKEAKLQSGTLQISAARKEMLLATEEFQRLRKANADLREKLQSAEQENGSLMRSLSPLLKQILQSEDDPPTKD
ncbi:MAG: hypothetical protein FD138_828 [Planctomycetota bacterium]|nr:MAG: hypothetical protein FD138_828 [Planctomycetota bacterium]